MIHFLEFIGCEFPLAGFYVVLELGQFADTGDDRTDHGAVQQPGNRELCRGVTAGPCKFRQRFDGVVAGFGAVIIKITRRTGPPGSCPAILRGFLSARISSSEESATQREKGQYANTGPLAVLTDVRLNFPLEHVIVLLHADGPVPAMELGQIVAAAELPAIDIGQAHVADLAAAHHVIQRLHHFLHGKCCVVQDVHLVQVDVVGFQPFQAGIELFGEIDSVRHAVGMVSTLRCDHEFVSAARDAAADELFGISTTIQIRRIDERNPHVTRCADNLVYGPLVYTAAAESIGTKADGRNFKTGCSQRAVLHLNPLNLMYWSRITYCARH